MNLKSRIKLAAPVKVGPKRKRKRRAKSWLHVNIGEREAKELRALAECLNQDLRGFLERAVRSAEREACGQLNLSAPYYALAIPRWKRLEMGRWRGEFFRAMIWSKKGNN